MTTAIVGLGGGIIGGLMALLGAVLADRRQARTETRRWRRDQLSSAYEQALRYLLRAANRRSEFVGGRGSAVLRREHQREWFDDLVEAQIWLRTVARYCDAAQLDRIRRAADHLDEHVSRLVSGERFDEKDFSIHGILHSCIRTVTECARVDGSSNILSVPVDPDARDRAALATENIRHVNNSANARRSVPSIALTSRQKSAADGNGSVELSSGGAPETNTEIGHEPLCKMCGSDNHTDGWHNNKWMGDLDD